MTFNCTSDQVQIFSLDSKCGTLVNTLDNVHDSCSQGFFPNLDRTLNVVVNCSYVGPPFEPAFAVSSPINDSSLLISTQDFKAASCGSHVHESRTHLLDPLCACHEGQYECVEAVYQACKPFVLCLGDADLVFPLETHFADLETNYLLLWGVSRGVQGLGILLFCLSRGVWVYKGWGY